MKKRKLIKIDGANLYILGDLIYIDEEYYSHFYQIEAAYNHYKEIQQALRKNISFRFLDNDIYINKKTTLDDVKNQILKQQEAKNYMEINYEDSKIKTMYDSYIVMNNDVRYYYPSVEKTKGKYKIN